VKRNAGEGKEGGGDRKLTVIPMDQMSALQSYPFSCSMTCNVLQRIHTPHERLSKVPVGVTDSGAHEAVHLWGHPARCANEGARFQLPRVETTLTPSQHPPSRSQTD
jgi:hypothetical protein